MDSLHQLAALRHANPHSLLGGHAAPSGGTLLRVFRPDASRVAAHLPGVHLELTPHATIPGLFEAIHPTALGSYVLEIDRHDGRKLRTLDPYAFWPTLGDDELKVLVHGQEPALWRKLGARPVSHLGVDGTSFTVWAPHAMAVSVVGDFNGWDERLHQLRNLAGAGFWELFVPHVGAGARYRFHIRQRNGQTTTRADPLARRAEVPPLTASIVHRLDGYQWGDAAWLQARAQHDVWAKPVSVYEVHLGSWRRMVEDGGRPLNYREAGLALAGYCRAQGFTHVELLPVAEHPFGGSWGYQVTSYFAPTARYGAPDDFRAFVDTLHQAGIGVYVDWVPAHFPKDAWALADFDGTSLYEHPDPRKGQHPDWGTLIFNLGRNEVRNFLAASALVWLDEYHVDGLRVDAVSSMLYLDYSRKPGEWAPNEHGGRENLEAVSFFQELTATVKARFPGAQIIAEESTAWPKVTHAPKDGGLGFDQKWNMGWMNDTLKYFSHDPIFRKHHHQALNFGLMYAFSERFTLALSHDEVVHGKRSLLGKMPGDEWQRFANLRALYGWMWAHPGKKLLFMGGELGQWNEWDHDKSLDWHLLRSAQPKHAQLQALVARLNGLYAAEGALFESDWWQPGFQWVQADNADMNVLSFVRRGVNGWREIVVAANLSPVVRTEFALGVPAGGYWEEILNTDDVRWGGSGVVNEARWAHPNAVDGQPGAITVTLPPLGVCWWARTDPKEPVVDPLIIEASPTQ